MPEDEQLWRLRPEQSGRPQSPERQMQAGIGLAVASLALGVVSLPLSVILVGAAAGLAGVVVAAIHLSRRLPFRAMAVWGLVLSILGTAGGAGFVLFYAVQMHRTYSMMEQAGQAAFEEYVGEPAPDLAVQDIAAKTVKLSEFRGKPVVLVFWATWCAPCLEEVPNLIKLREAVPPEKLAIIGLSREPADKIKPFAEKYGISYTLASVGDQSLGEPYDSVTSIPTTFFIDKQGLIQDVFLGGLSYDQLKAVALGGEANTNQD